MLTKHQGTNPEYIQGIHMIPLNPCTALIRNPTFGEFAPSRDTSMRYDADYASKSAKNGRRTLAMARSIA